MTLFTFQIVDVLGGLHGNPFKLPMDAIARFASQLFILMRMSVEERPPLPSHSKGIVQRIPLVIKLVNKRYSCIKDLRFKNLQHV